MRMKNQKDASAKHLERIEHMLRVLDEETNYQYTKTIQNKNAFNEVNFLIKNEKYREVLSKKYRKVVQAMGWKRKLLVYGLAICPWAMIFRRELHRK